MAIYPQTRVPVDVNSEKSVLLHLGLFESKINYSKSQKRSKLIFPNSNRQLFFLEVLDPSQRPDTVKEEKTSSVFQVI